MVPLASLFAVKLTWLQVLNLLSFKLVIASGRAWALVILTVQKSVTGSAYHTKCTCKAACGCKYAKASTISDYTTSYHTCTC